MKILIERDPERCPDVLVGILAKRVPNIAVECFSGNGDGSNAFRFCADDVRIETKDSPGADNARSYDIEMLVVFGASVEEVAGSKTLHELQTRFGNLVRKLIPERVGFCSWFSYTNTPVEEV
ncbi:MAG: hypothetical protein HYU81_00250 [Candidatus Brennerbacteria bacterium]|nr:hypothetical protein [Candidatus Brennerbacteria bacterium]